MDQNRLSEYRDIRYKRTYRTIGKMSWWRIVLGIVLIIFVLLLSGFPSQMLAARGQFHAAEKLMISPDWMERYKPETKAFIEAGVLYQNGEYAAASSAFGSITEVDAAISMKSASDLRLASERFDTADYDSAFDLLTEVEFSLLSEDDGQLYLGLCRELYEHFSSDSGAESKVRTQELELILETHSET